MKCIKEIKTGKVVKIANEAAKEAVDKGDFNYVSKSDWKAYLLSKEIKK